MFAFDSKADVRAGGCPLACLHGFFLVFVVRLRHDAKCITCRWRPYTFRYWCDSSVVLLLLIQLGALRYAYTRLGVSSGTALAFLCGSLIGSYINIPITESPINVRFRG